MTLKHSVVLALLSPACLDSSTDLSTTRLDTTTGSSTTHAEGSDTSSTTTVDTSSTTSTGPAPCDDDPACGPGEDVDTCPAQCSVCGDGIVSGPEPCDNGPDNHTYWPTTPPDGACSDDCTLTLEWCGDDEPCDNGNNTDAPYHDQGPPPPGACAPGCLPVAYCGDNTQNGPDEQCDTAGNSNTCDADCTTPACGDGTLNPAATELCDDNNNDDADNCSADCLFLQRRVFVSSTPYKGDMNPEVIDPIPNLNGIPLADARCQQLASAAALSGNYKAWLSDDTTSPSQRFDTTFSGRYRLLSPNNFLLATGWQGLTDGTLSNPIAADQTGASLTSNVWTNTLPDGTPASSDHCNSWTSFGDTTSIIGKSSAVDSTWTNLGGGQFCSNALRIYCFEDP